MIVVHSLALSVLCFFFLLCFTKSIQTCGFLLRKHDSYNCSLCFSEKAVTKLQLDNMDITRRHLSFANVQVSVRDRCNLWYNKESSFEIHYQFRHCFGSIFMFTGSSTLCWTHWVSVLG